MPTPDAGIGCEATPNGRIKLLFIHEGETKGGVEIPPEGLAGVVAMLIAAATKAAELSGQGL